MKKLKIISLLILLALLFASCENVFLPDPDKSADETSGDKTQVGELPVTDEYNNYIFHIAVTDGNEYKFVYNESEKIIRTAVEQRNDLVREKYGISVVAIKMKESEAAANVRNSNLAESQYADLLCFPGNIMSELDFQGELYNFYDLPGFDPKHEFIGEKFARATAENQKLYMLYNTASFYYDDMYVVFYNKTMTGELGLADPAVTAEAGGWTWQKLTEYAESAAAETMEKAKPNASSDIYGFGSRQNEDKLIQILWSSCGQAFFGGTYKKTIEPDIDFVAAQAVITQLKPLLDNKSRNKLDGTAAGDNFKNSRLLFLVDKLEFASQLENARFEWGILPLPKLNAAQSGYHNLIDANAHIFGIPRVVDDAKRTSTLLNAYCAASGNSIKKAIYNKYVNLYFQNNGSTVLLESIMDGAYFDFTEIFGGVYTEISDISVKIVNTAFKKEISVSDEVAKKLEAFRAFSIGKFG